VVEPTRLLRTDIEEARAEIQKAIGLLVTRFGRTSDLWGHLQLALDRLTEPSIPREPAVATPDSPPDEVKLPDLPPVEEEAAADIPEVPGDVEPEEEPEVPPEAPRQYRRRKE
jgi:hypothetical protein